MTFVAPAVAEATTDLYNQMGPIANYGEGDAVAGFPWLRFLDGIGEIMQRLNDLALDDLANGDPGWSIILDPTRCPTYCLPWLAQLAGVRFNPITQTTQGAMQAAILAGAAYKRGTLGAMQAVAQQYLQPGQFAFFFERDTSPYHLTVVISTGLLAPASYYTLDNAHATYTAMDGAFGTYAEMLANYSGGDITAALEAAKPAGLQMTVNFTAGTTYATVDGAFGSYTALDAAFHNYMDIIYYT